MAEIGVATRDEVAAFFYDTVDQPVVRIDGEVVALGGITRRGPTAPRVWGSLHFAANAGMHGPSIVRAVRRYLRQRNETIHVVCGFPAAGRLLTVLGFAPIDEWVADGKQVWIWRTR